jgi:hypothetical protein
MAPLKLPPPCRAAGFTVTISVEGRLPEEGDTVSQFPLLLVIADAENEVVPELLDTPTFWVTGTVLFAAKLKLSDVGLAESGLGPPAGLALN